MNLDCNMNMQCFSTPLWCEIAFPAPKLFILVHTRHLKAQCVLGGALDTPQPDGGRGHLTGTLHLQYFGGSARITAVKPGTKASSHRFLTLPLLSKKTGFLGPNLTKTRRILGPWMGSAGWVCPSRGRAGLQHASIVRCALRHTLRSGFFPKPWGRRALPIHRTPQNRAI